VVNKELGCCWLKLH